MNQLGPWLLTTSLLLLPARSATQAPDDSLRLYEPVRQQVIHLVDTQSTIVHSWPTQGVWKGGIALQDDGTLLRTPFVLPTGAVQRIAFDGTLLWEYLGPPGLVIHHDVEPLPNGNVLLMVMETKTRREAIAQGRSPALVEQIMQPDAIIEVQPTGPTSGAIVWEWHVWDHLVQDYDPRRANFGVVAHHPELIDINYPSALFRGTEFNHTNGVDYDPIHDWIVISSPVQNEIWIIDHSTTTAEAAGHTGGQWGKGGDLLYRWGNPAAYRAGLAGSRKLGFQHDPRFIPPGYPGAGNVTVFNNRYTATQSQVIELVLPVDPSGNFILQAGSAYGPDVPVWSYTAPGFFSAITSGAERLPNGNTLVCSGKQGWLFEVTPAGAIVWQHLSPVGAETLFHAHHTRRTLWTDRPSISSATGGTVRFDLEADSVRADQIYIMLGSSSGTRPGFSVGGINVPLNVDSYTSNLLGSVGRGTLTSWVGILDSTGGARASYTLPPLPFLTGLGLDHAMLVLSPGTTTLNHASNAEPLTLVR